MSGGQAPEHHLVRVEEGCFFLGRDLTSTFARVDPVGPRSADRCRPCENRARSDLGWPCLPGARIVVLVVLVVLAGNVPASELGSD